jgi:hypothetical protein
MEGNKMAGKKKLSARTLKWRRIRAKRERFHEKHAAAVEADDWKLAYLLIRKDHGKLCDCPVCLEGEASYIERMTS